MRALPPPAVRPRLSSVQPVNDAPSAAVVTRRGPAVGAGSAQWLARYQEWQQWARRYARQMGVARFSAGIVADTCARCIIRVEENDPNGDWGETQDPRLTRLWDEYRNPRQDPAELLRMHSWHYQVAGEMFQAMTDGPDGIEWWVFSAAAVEFKGKDEQRTALVKFTPDGKPSDGTAIVIPAANVVRFWIPDEEWQALATSPMAASIDDLHRYRALARYAHRTAESAVAMTGLLWAPGEAFEVDANEQEDPGAGIDQPVSPLERAYYDLARLRFDDDDDIAAIAPPLVHWDKNLGEPKWVKIAEGLDANGIAHRKEALEDFARGTNLPASLVVGGGPGDANHWTEWLVDEKFFESAVAPTMNRITHQDLTRTFLLPALRMYGLDERRYRIGYDAGPVLVKPDQSDTAHRLWLDGLLKGEAVLEASNFDADDMATPDDIARLLEVLSKQQQGSAITVQGPAPEGAPNGGTPPAPPTAPQAAITAAARPATTARAAARLLSQLARLRSGLGRELLASAELAYAEALRRAGATVKTKSRRLSNGKQREVAEALARGAALRPHMAALGLAESDLLREAFDTYQAQAERRIAQYQAKARAAIERAEMNPDEFLPSDETAAAGAALLAGSLLAMARDRIVNGTDPTAIGPNGTPGVVGEVTGSVPGRMVIDAVRVAEGTATATPGATADAAPLVTRLADRPTIAEQIARRALENLRAVREDNLARARGEGRDVRAIEDAANLDEPTGQPVYVWRWGFYGEPTSAFEPHQDLGAVDFATTDPLGDPALVNDASWPEAAFYQPGDHDGCTCEWEIVLPDGSTEVQLRLDAPEQVE